MFPCLISKYLKIIHSTWESCNLFTELCNSFYCRKTQLYLMDMIKTTEHYVTNGKPGSGELVKSASHIIVEIIEYVPKSVVIRTIIKKSTGNISVMSFDSGEGLTEKISPFETYAQIIDGMAEIVIDNNSYLLETGQGIIIPAHLTHFIKPNGRFKMILTNIGSVAGEMNG